MRLHLPTRWLRRSVLAVLGVLLVAGLLSDTVAFDWVPKKIRRARRHIGQALQGAGVVAHWDFDDSVIREAVAGAPCISGGTRRVPGRFGHARLFLPPEEGGIRTGVPAGILTNAFSLSCWLKFPAHVVDQSIVQHLAVEDGMLTAGLAADPPLRAPIPRRGGFFHCAITADAASRRARMYLDGQPVAEAALRELRPAGGWLVFGQGEWRSPGEVVLDEFSFWNRALPEQDVRRLSALRRDLATTVALGAVLELRFSEWLDSLIRTLFVALDLFHPVFGESRLQTGELPVWNLRLSKGDRRAFNLYHNTRVEHGLTAQGTSVKRTVDVAFKGDDSRATMELVGNTSLPEHGRPRWTFTLDYASTERSGSPQVCPPGEDAQRPERPAMEGEDVPSRKWLFTPFENGSFMLDLVAGELTSRFGCPVVAPELCVVRINGGITGLYRVKRVRCDPGLFWIGAPDASLACLGRLPLAGRDALRAFDERAARVLPLLLSDRRGPLCIREVRHAVREQRERLATSMAERAEAPDRVGAVVRYIGEDLFLNGNPWPGGVWRDLDFSLVSVGGCRIDYRSLAPERVSEEGRVTLPDTGAVPVRVEATVRCDGAAATKTLEFAVLPRNRRLPVLTVQTCGEIGRDDTVPCVLRYWPTNATVGPVCEGRIRLRGNTALVRAQKKYYFIRLSEPRRFGELGATRRLLLTSCYRDPAFMKDKLSYDLFRSFSEPGKPRFSPHVQYAELVLNGEYWGIYDLSERVDEDLLGFREPAVPSLRPPVLYKGKGAHAGFATVSRGDYVQNLPNWKRGAYWGPYEELIRFLGQSDAPTFREQVERRIDVDNVIDYQILLYLTSNMDGRNANLYLARAGGAGSRFFLVPWDYDMAFREERRPRSHLTQRLEQDLPGYRQRLSARWKELRKDRLATASVMKRMDEMDGVLAEGVGRDAARWPREDGLTHAQAVEALKQWLRTHLAGLDNYFEGMGASPSDTL